MLITTRICLIIQGYLGCESNPCENAGTCRRVHEDSYICTCVAGTKGRHCEGKTSFVYQDHFARQQYSLDWITRFFGIIRLCIKIILHVKNNTNCFELQVLFWFYFIRFISFAGSICSLRKPFGLYYTCCCGFIWFACVLELVCTLRIPLGLNYAYSVIYVFCTFIYPM